MKRSLSFILALIMVLSMFPAVTLFHAHAEDATAPTEEVVRDWYRIIAWGKEYYEWNYTTGTTGNDYALGNLANSVFQAMPTIAVDYTDGAVTLRVTGEGSDVFTSADMDALASVIYNGYDETAKAHRIIPGTKRQPAGARFVRLYISAALTAAAGNTAAVKAEIEAFLAAFAAIDGAVLDGILVDGGNAATVNDVVYGPLQAVFADAALSICNSAPLNAWQSTYTGAVAAAGNTAYHYIRTNATVAPTGYRGSLDSPFFQMMWDAIRLREAKEANGNVQLGVYAIQNVAFGSAGNNSNWAKEVLYHAALLDADFIYQSDNDSWTYYSNATQAAVNNLGHLLGWSDRKPIDTPYSWNNDFLVSGMYVNGANMWRITLNVADGATAADYLTDGDDVVFNINGQTVTFPAGEIVAEPRGNAAATGYGYWVKTAKDVVPTVSYAEDRYADLLNQGLVVHNDTFSSQNFLWQGKVWGSNRYPTTSATAVINTEAGVLEMTGDSHIILNDPMGGSYGVWIKNHAKYNGWFGAEVQIAIPEAGLPEGATVEVMEVITSNPFNGGFVIKDGKVYYSSVADDHEIAELENGETYILRKVTKQTDLTNKALSELTYEVRKADGTLVGTQTWEPGHEWYSAANIYGIGFIATGLGATVVNLDNFKQFLILENDTTLTRYDAATGATTTAATAAQGYKFSWANYVATAGKIDIIANFYEGETLVKTEHLQTVDMAGNADGVVSGVVTAPAGQTVKIATCKHTSNGATNCLEAEVCTTCNAVLREALGSHTPGAAATCVDDQVCTVCNAVVVEAFGHNRGKDATCTVCEKLLPNAYVSAFDTVKFPWSTATSNGAFWSNSGSGFLVNGTMSFDTPVDTTFAGVIVKEEWISKTIGYKPDGTGVNLFAVSAQVTLPEDLPGGTSLGMLTSGWYKGTVDGGIILKDGQFYWWSSETDDNMMTMYVDELVLGATYTVRREYDMRINGGELLSYYVYDAAGHLIAEKVDVPLSLVSSGTADYKAYFMARTGFRMTLPEDVYALDNPVVITEMNGYEMSDNKYTANLETVFEEDIINYTVSYTNRYYKDAAATLYVTYNVEGETYIEKVEMILNGFDAGTIESSVDTLGLTAEDIEFQLCVHNIVKVERKEATCTEDGYEAYEYCTDCSKADEIVVLPKTGHTAGEPVKENEQENGAYEKVIYCTVCETELSREPIAPCEHNYVQSGTTPPSFGVAGKIHYTCEICQATKDEDAEPALTEADATPETLADLLAIAPEGATINLLAGTYTRITIPAGKNGLTLVGKDGAIVNYLTMAEDAVINGLNLVNITFVEADGMFGEDADGKSIVDLRYAKVTDLSITGCTFTGIRATKQLNAIHTGAVAGNVAISGNTIKNFSHNAIQAEITANANVVITGNTIINCGSADVEAINLYKVGADAVVEITGNTITDCFASHVVILLGSVEYNFKVDETADVTISGNTHNGAELVANDANVEGIRSITATSADATHTAGDPVVEGEEEVTYCAVCGQELSREPIEVACPHTSTATRQEEVVDATCTTAGSYVEVTYCTECEEEISRETITVDALGHTTGETVITNIYNGVNNGAMPSYDITTTCTVCGKTITEKITLTQKVISGMTMALNDSLEVKFTVFNDLLPAGAYAKIVRAYSDGTEDDIVIMQRSEFVAYQSGKDAIPYNKLAACQMIDTFQVFVYNSEDEIIGVYTESIREYAMKKLAQVEAQNNAKGKALFVDMLNYGAAAQNHFGYATNDLANSLLTETQKGYATASEIGGDYQVLDAATRSTTVSLESRIELNFNFHKTHVTNEMRAVFAYTTVAGQVNTVEMAGEDFKDFGTYWRATVGMPLVEGKQIVTCTIYDGDTVVATAKDSLEGYLTRKYTAAPIMEATWAFIKSASAYFAQ